MADFKYRNIIGGVIAMIGMLVVLAEAGHIYIHREEQIKLWIIGIGVLIAFVGGSIIDTKLTETIGKNAASIAVPIIEVIRTGRRKTDPAIPVVVDAEIKTEQSDEPK